MAPPTHRLHIRKDAFKFSSAHVTVFPDGTKERLHGHNYMTGVSIDTAAGALVPFREFKSVIKEICDAWDERVFLAEHCPFFTITSRTDVEIDFLLCSQHYVLPTQDVVLLPLDNITCETLASEFLRLFLEKLGRQHILKAIKGIQVRIDEIPGQGASSFWQSP